LPNAKMSGIDSAGSRGGAAQLFAFAVSSRRRRVVRRACLCRGVSARVLRRQRARFPPRSAGWNPSSMRRCWCALFPARTGRPVLGLVFPSVFFAVNLAQPRRGFSCLLVVSSLLSRRPWAATAKRQTPQPLVVTRSIAARASPRCARLRARDARYQITG